MAEIAQKVFAIDGTKNLLRLYNEEFVRPVVLPSTWARLRLAVAAAVTDTGGNIPNVTAFFGFCSTPASPFTDVSTIHAVGFEYSNNTLTRGGTTNPYYTWSGGTSYGNRRINGVNNRSSAGIGPYTLAATGGALNRRAAIIVDLITATSGVTIYLQQGSVSVLDTSPSQFVEATETLSPNWAGGGMSATATTPGGSSAAPLDTVNIYWGNGLAPLEIYAMAAFVYPL